MSAFDAHHMDHAIAVEKNIRAKPRRILRIGAIAIERSFESTGDVAAHFQVVNVAFDTNRRRIAAIDEQIGKVKGRGGCVARLGQSGS